MRGTPDGGALGLELLQHSSVRLDMGPVRLLTDPWFEGTAFRGRWGLRWSNDQALADAALATHLWVSHPHGDHFHAPTLRRLAPLAPDLVTLANVSVNFDLAGGLRATGLRRVEPLGECEPRRLAPDVEVYRQPATGIDNMLFVRAGGLVVLHYNDCNLPARAVRALVRRHGPVDVLLCNYNHANKLQVAKPPDETRREYLARFLRLVDVVGPTWVVPFASLHVYRSPRSLDQNAALLEVDELAAASPRVVALAPGDGARFRRGAPPEVERRGRARPVPFEPLAAGATEPLPALRAKGDAWLARLRTAFGPLARLVPPLRVAVDDLAVTLELDLRRGARPTQAAAHIAAPSWTLGDCFGSPYGADAMWIGADFTILPGADLRPLRAFMLTSTLDDNRLGARDLLGMLRRREGRAFFLHRRQEIAAVLLGGRFFAMDGRL